MSGLSASVTSARPTIPISSLSAQLVFVEFARFARPVSSSSTPSAFVWSIMPLLGFSGLSTSTLFASAGFVKLVLGLCTLSVSILSASALSTYVLSASTISTSAPFISTLSVSTLSPSSRSAMLIPGLSTSATPMFGSSAFSASVVTLTLRRRKLMELNQR